MFTPGKILLFTAFMILVPSSPGAGAPSSIPEASPFKDPSQALVPFSEFAESFLRNHDLKDLERNEDALPTLLDNGYVVAGLGLFDLWYPREALRKAPEVKVFKSVAAALLDLQDMFVTWVAEDDVRESNQKDVKTLSKWIQSWKAGKLVRKSDTEGSRPDLLGALDSDEAVAEASRNFAHLMKGSLFAGREGNKEDKDKKKSLLLIVSPTREDFLGLGSFIGSLSDENRKLLWVDGLALWTSFSRDGIHVISLEHPSNYPGRGDITQGLDMNAKEKTGLLQHVVQNAGDLLLKHYYQDLLPPELISGMSMNLVIDMYKENNVRSGGGSGGNETGSYRKFIRGGKSSGGLLPGRSADSRWRQTKGKDHFLEILRLAQKIGAKESPRTPGKSRDKRLHFALEPDGGGPAFCVQAPFFSAAEGGDPVPEDCLNDFLEFFRAYRSGFAYWLQNKAKTESKEESPPELLRRLLQATGPDKANKPFKEIVLEVYGIPFSVEDCSVESLETRFLAWLADGK